MPLQEKDLKKYFAHLDGEIKNVGASIKPFLKTDDQRNRLTKISDAVGLREPQANAKLIGELAQVQRASHVSNTLAATTDAIIGTVAVFRDKDADPQEKASAVLKCFSSFSQLAALGGPIGLAVGTTISSLLGMMSMILEATAEPRESMIDQFETVVRKVEGEAAAAEVAAARDMFELQEAALEAFPDNGSSWTDIMATAPLTSDISTFALHTTAGWLVNPNNFHVKQWEEIFSGYCATLTEVFALYTTVLAKLVPDDHPKLLSVARVFGTHVQSFLAKVENQVMAYGQYWHVGDKTWGYRSNYFLKPEWADSDIGSIAQMALSPRGQRLWTRIAEGNHGLTTGKLKSDGSKDAQLVAAGGLSNCADFCIVKGDTGNKYHLVVVPEADAKVPADQVLVNEWTESSAKFSRPTFKAALVNDTTGTHGKVVMARPFQARTAGEPTAMRYVYFVRKTASASALSYGRWEHLRDGEGVQTTAVAVVPRVDGNHFRIATSDEHVYVFTDHHVWRKTHDAILAGVVNWEQLPLPKGASMVSDFEPFENDGFVAVIDRKMWQGMVRAKNAETDPTVIDWVQSPQGSGSRLVKRAYESADAFEQAMKIARSYTDGSGLHS